MEFTDKEIELLAWLAEKHWDEFSDMAEQTIGVNGMHRIAEKLKLQQAG